jgi:hypothetical protein
MNALIETAIITKQQMNTELQQSTSAATSLA